MFKRKRCARSAGARVITRTVPKERNVATLLHMDILARLSSLLQGVCDAMLVHPLRTLYLRGPAPLFWQGKALHDICAQTSGFPAIFWESNSEECARNVETRFQSFYVGACFVGLSLTVYKILSTLWFRYMVVGPIVREIHAATRCLPGHIATLENIDDVRKKLA